MKKITVCIKQVPDTFDIKWTENNTIQREGVESIINPFDVYAIEEAIKLKSKFNAEIKAITMGPFQAKEILRYAIAKGADTALLLSDKKFAASDTIATSEVLSAAIKYELPDLVLCGQMAIDGDTAQTGPMIASNLCYALVTNVKQIINYENNELTVEREVEDGCETIKVKLPAVICVLKGNYEPTPPTINGFKKAQGAEIATITNDLLNIENTGIKGSPTFVSKAFRGTTSKGIEPTIPNSPQEAAQIIYRSINE